MKRRVPILLALLALSATLTAAVTHTCIHDQLLAKQRASGPIPKATILSDEAAVHAVKVEPTVLGVYEAQTRADDGYKPIRIAFFSEDLNDPSRYCTAAGDLRPDFQGNNQVLCTQQDVLTAEKKKLLLEELMPAAIKLHADRLLVEPITQAVALSPMSSTCSQFTIPASHKQNGVSGADFYVYLSAGPTQGNTIAWATTCQAYGDRPLVGVINMSPKYIQKDDDTVRVMGHEMLHALGFNGYTFGENGMLDKVPSLRGKTDVSVVTTPQVLAEAKKHFGCNTMTGMEVEDQGGAGTAGSHWKRRNAKDDIMAGISGVGFYTALTIALMEDTGYYKGNYANAEHMSWGYQAGCKLVDNKCVVDGVSQVPSMFCTVENRMVCTSDRKALGECILNNQGVLAAPYQYFGSGAATKGSQEYELMDYCPYVQAYTNTGCATGEVAVMPGSEVDSSSRCFDSSAGVAVAGYADPRYALCARVICDETARTYKVQFAGATSAVPCTPGGSVTPGATSGKFSGGSVSCPYYSEVCYSTYVAPPKGDGGNSGTGNGGNSALTSGFSGATLVAAAAFLFAAAVN